MLRKAEGADRGEGVLRPSVSEANLIPALPLAFITSQWCFESVRYIWIPASCNTMPKAHSKQRLQTGLLSIYSKWYNIESRCWKYNHKLARISSGGTLGTTQIPKNQNSIHEPCFRTESKRKRGRAQSIHFGEERQRYGHSAASSFLIWEVFSDEQLSALERQLWIMPADECF